MRCVAAALLGPLLLLSGPTALAQPAAVTSKGGPTPEDKALAEALFQDGRKLIDAGQIADACPKFAESQRLDPSAGTLLNLAICHEKEGRTASAWAELKEAASMSESAGKADRAEFARKRAAELEAKLSRLVLEVAAPAPGMVIRLNGKDLSVAAAAGTGMPVDPGKHTVEATAPGKKPWSQSVLIEPGQSTKRVEIPALEDPPRAPPPPKENKNPGPKEKVTAPPPDGGGASLRTLGFVAGGVGLVGLGVGSVFGVMTLSRAGDVDEGCQQNGCSADEVALNDKAYTSATISTIAFGAGLAFLGAGAALVILSGPSPSEASASAKKTASQLWLSPQVASTGAQVTLGGRW